MPVTAEIRFSPEVTPYKLTPKSIPPTVAEQTLRLFGDRDYELSFQPLIALMERIRTEGASVAILDADPRNSTEFLLAPAQESATFMQNGGMLQALRVMYRPWETNSYHVESMLPTRRQVETGREPEPLRPTIEMSLVTVTTGDNGEVSYEQQEFPTIEVLRWYEVPTTATGREFTLVVRDQSGESREDIDSALSAEDAQTTLEAKRLIGSVGQLIHRHEELVTALAAGESGLSDKTAVELVAEVNQQLVAAMRTATALLPSGQPSPELALANQALAGLSPRERQIFMLKYGIGGSGQEITNAELARQLQISPSVVRQHLENALRKLRVHFGDQTA